MPVQQMREFRLKPKASQSIWVKVGLPAGEGPVLCDAINHGFSIDVVNRFAEAVSIPVTNLVQYAGLSRATFARRVKDKEHRLKPNESEAFARMIRMYEAATLMLGGDKGDAIQWLNEPAVALNGKRPIDLMGSESGTFDVIRLINRLMHGVYI
ncbi:MAG: type II RES/Xre toxin-antitoxin system antitoxin [Shewanella sp.]